MLADAQLLETFVVLEHFAEVDRNTLADRLVDWVVNIQLYQGLVARVEDGENTDDAIVVDFVVAEIQRLQLVVSKQQLSNHHRAVRLNLVAIQVESLQACTVLQSIREVLCAFRLDLVALKTEADKPGGLSNQVSKRFCADISDFVVAEVDIFDVDSVELERFAYGDQVLVGYAICEHELVVSIDLQVQ